MIQMNRWEDINNVINHKKTFRIECNTEIEFTKHFIFRDSRSAKYMWRLCIAQHTFYMQHQQLPQPPDRMANSYLVSILFYKKSFTKQPIDFKLLVF